MSEATKELNERDTASAWQELQERAQKCPLLKYYFSAYRVFGPDANIGREQFLARLSLKVHDHYQAASSKALEYAALEMYGIEYIREKMGTNNAVTRGSLFSWLEHIESRYDRSQILAEANPFEAE